MATSSSSDQLTLNDAFDLLQVSSTASSAEIRKSYRTLSLRLHPDKARDIPPELAATRFHNLHRAYELLSDPSIRAKLELQAAEEAKRRERVGKFEDERKKMSEDLLKREREIQASSRRAAKERLMKEQEMERLKEESKRMKAEWEKERQDARRAGEEAARGNAQDEEGDRGRGDDQEQLRKTSRPAGRTTFTTAEAEPSLGALDTTIRVLYPSHLEPTISTSLEPLLVKLFGPIVHVRHTAPSKQTSDTDPTSSSSSKKRKSKADEATMTVTFEDLEAALRAVEGGTNFRLADAVASKGLRQGLGMDDDLLDQIWIEWARAKEVKKKRKEAKKMGGGQGRDEEEETLGSRIGEPERVKWWRRVDPRRIKAILRSGEENGTNGQGASQGSNEHSIPPKNGTGSQPGALEADVLRRAMEASARSKAAMAAKEQEMKPS